MNSLRNTVTPDADAARTFTYVHRLETLRLASVPL